MTSSNAFKKFTGNFTQQEPIPQDAINAAVSVMQGGRLHRYNVAHSEELSETALLEIEYAQYQEQRYCLACASGGYALQLAMRAWGIKPDEPVLTNGFTLSPVPGAIQAVGGRTILVETTSDLVIDLAHLEAMIKSTGSRLLLLSHMRGHLVDMDALCKLLEAYNVAMIEDCAHTMGASFRNGKSGTHGVMSCFSTQTYKHINSGEGGLLTSNDDEMMARAIILSGSYMLFERHEAAPSSEVFDSIKLDTPNCSGRMDNLRAAILRPQLLNLDANGTRWNERYNAMATALGTSSNSIQLPNRHPDAYEVPSSIQFQIPRFTDEQNLYFLEQCMQHGVELKWFGAEDPKAYTSRYDSWRYIESAPLPNTDAILKRLYDCRLPLTFSVDDCTQIGHIISDIEQSISAA
jgi:dTDP-4-amino-4,6-dideoxygalactose transaminase